MLLAFIRLISTCWRREITSEEQEEINIRRIRMLPLYFKKNVNTTSI